MKLNNKLILRSNIIQTENLLFLMKFIYIVQNKLVSPFSKSKNSVLSSESMVSTSSIPPVKYQDFSMLRRLGGQLISHQIFLIFLYMMSFNY